MIGRIQGQIININETSALVDVNGVGYIVHCASNTLLSLPQSGQSVILYIETVVRDDSISLYGFNDIEECNWFKLLVTVQGVGPRLAISILGQLSMDSLIYALQNSEHSTLKAVSGVGARGANRIVSELADKIPSSKMNIKTNISKIDDNIMEDAILALVKLGYTRSESYSAINSSISESASNDTSSLIRKSLLKLKK